MRRPNKDSSNKISADSSRMIALAQGLVQASSRLEERYWEQNLDIFLQKVLKANHQDHIDAALSHLFGNDLNAYDALMDTIEACSESCQLEVEENGVQVKYDALLVVAPILAWTRFAIGSGPIAADVCTTLSAHFNAHMLADGAKMALAPTLYSIDQMPHSHGEAYGLTLRLAQAALKGSTLHPNKKAPETAPFLADTRYLLFAVVVPHGSPFFRWQLGNQLQNFSAARDAALAQWKTQATPNIERLLPGCGVELMLPEAYYVACREADKAIRPISIRAAVHFLTHALSTSADQLRAVVAGFGEELSEGQVEEYRVGFTLRNSDEVLYGIVWPIYGLDEDEAVSSGLLPGSAKRVGLEEICALLQQSGVSIIKRHSERFPSEYCDDCGAPLFADPNGELVHPEMPEESSPGGSHLH